MLATSTIAMSSYNLLTLANVPVTAGQLYAVVCNGHGMQLDRKAFIEALQELVKRRFVAIVQTVGKPDHFTVVDPNKRRVRWRSREGDGWDNWFVEDPKGPQRLKEIVNGIH